MMANTWYLIMGCLPLAAIIGTTTLVFYHTCQVHVNGDWVVAAEEMDRYSIFKWDTITILNDRVPACQYH